MRINKKIHQGRLRIPPTEIDSLHSFASVTFRRSSLVHRRPFIFIHAVISFHLFHYRDTAASIETCSISDMTSRAHAKPLSYDSAECIELRENLAWKDSLSSDFQFNPSVRLLETISKDIGMTFASRNHISHIKYLILQF